MGTRPPASTDPPWLRVVVMLGILGAALHLLRFAAPEYVIDDAYITFRVARNWLETGVPTFDVTQPPAESSTTTSWMLLAAAWLRLMPATDPMVPARVLGALFHLATLALVLKLAVRLARDCGGSPSVAALVAALLFDTTGSIAYHALAGMETALYGFLFVAATERLLTLAKTKSPAVGWAAGGVLGALALTRPEGVLLSALMAGSVLLRRDLRPLWWRVAAPAVLIIVALEVWRWTTYGDLVPNTYYAKPPSPKEGFEYVRSYLLGALGIVGPLAVGPIVRRHLEARWLALLALVVLLSTAWSGGDWMPAFRRLLPTSLVLFSLAGASVAVVSGRLRVACALATAAWIGGNVSMAVAGTDSRAFNGEVCARFGRIMQESGLATVAIGDVGAFAWHFRGSVYDSYGLTDRHIAKLPGGYAAKEWDEAYFQKRNPDLVMLRSHAKNLRPAGQPQTDVMRSDKSMAEYIARSSDYRFRARLQYSRGMVVLMYVRKDVALPDHLWSHVPVPSLSEESVPQ